MKHRKSFRMKLLSLVTFVLLLCGFGWDWMVSFAASVLFPVGEAIDIQLVTGFPNLVDPDDLLSYLSDPQMAQQITQGIQSNLSADVYSGIEIPDMTQEPLGKKIIRTILDRILQ